MRRFCVIIIAFMQLLTEPGFIFCSSHFSHDKLIRKEVDDFEEFLRERAAKDPVLGSDISADDHNNAPILKDAHKHSGGYVNDGKEITENSGTLISNFAQDDTNFVEVHQHRFDQHNSERKPPNFDPVSNGEIESVRNIPETHHPVEEILFVRRSDSELNDPISDLLQRLVHGRARKANLDSNLEVSGGHPTTADSLQSDGCSSHNVTLNSDKVCHVSPEYEIRFHPGYSEILRQTMEGMLPFKDPDTSKCDYLEDLGTDKGVEDRALCPFEMAVGDRNPSRIPEYLYEAKCSCQVSRRVQGKRFRCVPIKKLITVLWKTCLHGRSMQKLGWEEIAVACGPIEEKLSTNVETNASE